MKRAFTLIELLIVVAIISILAAIAVPNFLHAQTRAKLAATLEDFRNLATVFEAYNVDSNTYPPGTANSVEGYAMYTVLTTPVPYTQNIYSMAHEQFYDRRRQVATGQEYYEVMWGTIDHIGFPPKPVAGSFASKTGMFAYNVARDNWWIESIGPDRGDDSYRTTIYPSAGMSITAYDPTNGLYSDGDLFRVGGAYIPRWAERYLKASYGAH